MMTRLVDKIVVCGSLLVLTMLAACVSVGKQISADPSTASGSAESQPSDMKNTSRVLESPTGGENTDSPDRGAESQPTGTNADRGAESQPTN